MKNLLTNIISLLTSFLLFNSVSLAEIPDSPRSIQSIENVQGALIQELSDKGLKYGSPIFLRIFKKTKILEVWVEKDSGKYQFFKSYDICYFSGDLGPKTKEGDNQAPEGFYYVTPNNLNPWSSYHLSFNLGYPNVYDRYYNRTGNALMVHGKCVSIGCYAMTDKGINEIYALAYSALKKGQSFFRVHIFPFEMTGRNLEKYKHNKWFSFWTNLKKGYDFFEKSKIPPNVEITNGKYVFN